MSSKIGFQLKAVESKTRTHSKVLFSSVSSKKEEKDLITCIQGKEIISSAPKAVEKPFVIPLVTRSDSKGQSQILEHIKRSKKISTSQSVDVSVSSEQDITTRAINELIQEANDVEEVDETNGTTNVAPISMVKRSTDENIDVEAEDADYTVVPIESYGAALLRGMGWDGVIKQPPSTRGAIGDDPLGLGSLRPRPKGLGLGADISTVKQTKKDSENGSQVSVTKQGDEELKWKPGAYCYIVAGRKSGMYGTIESIVGETERVSVRLAIGREMVEPLMGNVRLVTDREFKEQSKYLNKKEADEVRAKQMEKLMKDQGRHEDERDVSKEMISQFSKIKDSINERHSKSSSSHTPDQHRKRDRYEKSSQKHSERERESSKKHKHSSHSSHIEERSSTQNQNWLRPNLRVRVIDKNFKDGRYYKTKVIVVDMPSRGVATCKTDEGKYIGDLPVNSLETVIPRELNASVVIVRGEHKGTTAKLLEKNQKDSEVTVQLEDTLDLLRLSYDDVCECVM